MVWAVSVSSAAVAVDAVSATRAAAMDPIPCAAPLGASCDPRA